MTGNGEQIARMVLARVIVHLIDNASDPDAAAQRSIEAMAARVGGEAGAITMAPDGRIGWHHNSVHLPVAYWSEDRGPCVYLSKQEEAVWQKASAR